MAAATRYTVRVEKTSGGAPAVNATYLSADVCSGSLCQLQSPVTLARKLFRNELIQLRHNEQVRDCQVQNKKQNKR